MNRRQVFSALFLGLLAGPARAILEAAPETLLDAEQSRRLRAWITLMVATQLRAGPSPRWRHRDCAGLVRFAVREALRRHDAAWVRANGLQGIALPPEPRLTAGQHETLRDWVDIDGRRRSFVTALALIQGNCRALGRDLTRAEPGDLLFFDQGDDQHLMVWMGAYIAYHTGTATPSDNGLRAVAPRRLMNWEDTRWRPVPENSNYIGVYRLAFLSR
ncbi:MAG: DUF1175 family protein [Thiobacillus sp.]|nr:DUF1175 family protein [Thiobacillus sp.]